MTKVLVVDDTAVMRKMLTILLVKAGFFVVGEAENGKQAVELYTELKPDIVMMDVVMPEMTGIDALKQIKSIDENAKIVMCSTVTQEETVKVALNSGAAGYIIKPYNGAMVIEEIQRLLKNKS